MTGIQRSSTISATPSLFGSMQSPIGQSVANVRVELIAWPSGEFLGNVAIDAEVPVLVAAADRTAGYLLDYLRSKKLCGASRYPGGTLDRLAAKP